MDPIAIIGISARFPGASNPGILWHMMMEGRNAFAPLSDDLALPFGTTNLFEGCAYPTVAARLGAAYAFVSSDQTVTRQINAGENKDLYFATQLALEALEDAALSPNSATPLRGTVRFAYAPPYNPSTIHWLNRTLFADQLMDVIRTTWATASVEGLTTFRAKLMEGLPALFPGSFDFATAGRVADYIAHTCQFSAGASALDAGVPSGLVALSQAMDDLYAGRADVALAGAVSPPLDRGLLQGLSSAIHFSAAASSIPFDTSATGVLPGEGGAFFTLKRRADALKAHDRIYALIRAVSTDFENPLSTAAEAAQIPLSSIRMVEADGRGEKEADAAEIIALQKLWGDHKPGGPLVGVGSVKGNIGHTFTAAAAAQLVKVAFALHHRVLVPQVRVGERAEALFNLNSSVYLLDEPRAWITGDATSPRRAAILADDFGRARAAAILEEEPGGRL